MDSKLILVVDDETHVLNVVAMKFRSNGYEVLTARNGASAYKIAVENKPDLIITDYQMPAMNGLELCLQLSRHPDTRHTPTILLTAYGFSLDRDELERVNIRGLLPKPFSPQELFVRATDLLAECAASS